MMVDEIPIADQQKMIQVAGGLPPMWMYAEITTPDQKARFAEIKQHFTEVKEALAAFFSGKDNPIGKDNPQHRRFIQGEVDYYVTLYQMIWHCWDAIEAQAKADNLLALGFPSCPGDALALALELDCQAMLQPCMFGGTVSVRESYGLLVKMPEPNAVSGAAHKRALRSQEYAEEVRERSTGQFVTYCQGAIKKRLRGNSIFKTKLTQYQAVQKKRLGSIKKLLRDNPIRGEVWHQGKLTQN